MSVSERLNPDNRREGGYFSCALNNTSVWPRPGRGRKQHGARVIDWDADGGVRKGQKKYISVQKLFELWLYTQTCV